MRQFMADAELDAGLPLFLGEYNIAYAWWLDLEPGKMRSQVGAVFDALVAYYAIRGGHIQSLQAFNDRDGVYGKLSGTLNETVNEPRPAYHVLKYNNQLLKGSWHPVSSDDPEVLAVATSDGGKKAWMIVNRSLNNRDIVLEFTGYQPVATYFNQHIVNEELVSTSGVFATNSYNFTLPAESVVYFDHMVTSTVHPVKRDDLSNVQVFPNPISDIFELKSDQPWEQVIVMDQFGSVLRRFLPNEKMTARDLPAGTYFLQLVYKDGTISNAQKCIVAVKK
jgi:hypothetical protein